MPDVRPAQDADLPDLRVANRHNAVIGSCLVLHYDAPSALAELGDVLVRAHWGRGLLLAGMRVTGVLGPVQWCWLAWVPTTTAIR